MIMAELFILMGYNVRVYEPLRCQSALLSRYHKVTKRTDLRKPTASNGLYTLLAALIYIIQFDIFFFKIIIIFNFATIIASSIIKYQSNDYHQNFNQLKAL